MTGAGAAMRRVLEARAGAATVGEVEAEALAGLAERARELNEAVVYTCVDLDEVAAVRDEIAALTERLRAVRREHPPIGDEGAAGMTRQLASPVSGPLNPIAPPVHIRALPNGSARTEFELSSIYEGPPSFVHGGVSAMILDQILGVAASANGTPGMTATLELRYRRPTPHGARLVAEAEVARVSGRRTYVDARILGPDGRVTVEATAMFVMPTM